MLRSSQLQTGRQKRRLSCCVVVHWSLAIRPSAPSPGPISAYCLWAAQDGLSAKIVYTKGSAHLCERMSRDLPCRFRACSQDIDEWPRVVSQLLATLAYWSEHLL